MATLRSICLFCPLPTTSSDPMRTLLDCARRAVESSSVSLPAPRDLCSLHSMYLELCLHSWSLFTEDHLLTQACSPTHPRNSRTSALFSSVRQLPTLMVSPPVGRGRSLRRGAMSINPAAASDCLESQARVMPVSDCFTSMRSPSVTMSRLTRASSCCLLPSRMLDAGVCTEPVGSGQPS